MVVWKMDHSFSSAFPLKPIKMQVVYVWEIYKYNETMALGSLHFLYTGNH